jgi:hypothetical protein
MEGGELILPGEYLQLRELDLIFQKNTLKPFSGLEYNI